MSVILYPEEKFAKIASSLSFGSRDLAWLFEYPEGWQERGVIDNCVERLMFNLYSCNLAAFYNTYDQAPVITKIPFRKVTPYNNDFELLKSLKGLRYNVIANSGKETDYEDSIGKLDKLIATVSDRIISSLPEWEKAETW